MKITIIIPNYNGEYLLRKNLTSVFSAIEYYKERTKGTVEIIIVDDCSADDSTEYIKNQKSKIKNTNQKLKIIENERNMGFSSTVNRGVQEAKGEIVVLLNTDVAPQKDFLAPLIDHFKDPNVFAVGCMDKSIEDGNVVIRGRGIGQWKKGFLVHARGETDKKDTLWVSGGSGAFRKSVWEKLGGFNKLYNPFYWEDIDLSYRALKGGYRILFEPKSIVVHEHESGIIKKKYSSSKIRSIVYRNQFIFVWKNITDLDFQFLHLFWLPYHLLKALKNQDWPFFLGFFQAFLLLPPVIQASVKDQRYFIKSDKEVLSEFST